MKELFPKLQEMIKEKRVKVEPSRSSSGAVFGGPISSFLFMLFFIASFIGVLYYFLQKDYILSGTLLVGFIIIRKIWSKIIFYYLVARALRDYAFFSDIFKKRIIQLRLPERELRVEHPMAWTEILKAQNY